MTVAELRNLLTSIPNQNMEVVIEYPVYFDDGDGYIDEDFETRDVSSYAIENNKVVLN